MIPSQEIEVKVSGTCEHLMSTMFYEMGIKVAMASRVFFRHSSIMLDRVTVGKLHKISNHWNI